LEKPEGKRPLGRPRRRWEDNIKMDLREIGLDVVDWIHLAQGYGPVTSSCEQDNGPFMKGGKFLDHQSEH
jgi:hypothetical protein